MRRLVPLPLLAVLAACTGGGPSTPPTPVAPWGIFRHDTSNSGVGNAINKNGGNPSLLASAAELGGEITDSTPTIDLDSNILVGTKNGVAGLDKLGDLHSWSPLTTCALPCTVPTPCPTPVPIGAVAASPSVTTGGVIVFGTDGTDGSAYLFAVEELSKGDVVECAWAYRPPEAGSDYAIESSAAAIAFGFQTLIGAYFGAEDGVLRVLNGNGTQRWSYPTTAGPLTSSPALDLLGNTYLLTSDGVLSSVSSVGTLLWQYTVGIVPEAQREPFYPSPAVSATSVYAVGGSGALVAINPTAPQPSLKWRYAPITAEPISGSPAFQAQTFDSASTAVTDTIVYATDTLGTAYGIRDLTGMPMPVQRCALDSTKTCVVDSCPTGQTCVSKHCSGSGESCTEDSCEKHGLGICEVAEGIICVTGETPVAPGAPCPDVPIAVTTSPAVSGDLFVVVGTIDGRICARALDGTVPGETLESPTANWLSGCIQLPDDLGPTRSSPIIGAKGEIFVTTDKGLYVIE